MTRRKPDPHISGTAIGNLNTGPTGTAVGTDGATTSPRSTALGIDVKRAGTFTTGCVAAGRGAVVTASKSAALGSGVVVTQPETIGVATRWGPFYSADGGRTWGPETTGPRRLAWEVGCRLMAWAVRRL